MFPHILNSHVIERHKESLQICKCMHLIQLISFHVDNNQYNENIKLMKTKKKNEFRKLNRT